jgi:cyanophycinase
MKNPGKLMLVGGAEDRQGDCRILRKFVELSGKKSPRVVVMTVASGVPAEVGDEYRKAFHKVGAGHIDVVHASCREDANDAKLTKTIEAADAVFFTGGDQFRITTILGGTRADDLLHERFETGMALGGSSAGANMMPSAMIIGGNHDQNPRLGAIQIGPGMEFLPGAITDTHFSQRGRIGRLISAVAQYPHDLGIGIDEDTALVALGDYFDVIGTNAVTIVDMTTTTYSDAPRVEQGESLTLFDIKLHILADGMRFDFKNRAPVRPEHMPATGAKPPEKARTS